jgi:hypothetical protein
MAITDAKRKEAKAVFDSLVAHLNKINLKFAQEELEDRFVIRFNMSGDDIPMRFFLYVNPDKQIITLHSPQPVKFPADKLDLACKAICAINYRLSDGDFQIDVRDGEVLFNMSNCYAGSLISGDVFDYMLGMSINIVDEFNDKLLMLSKGMIGLDAIMSSLNY